MSFSVGNAYPLREMGKERLSVYGKGTRVQVVSSFCVGAKVIALRYFCEPRNLHDGRVVGARRTAEGHSPRSAARDKEGENRYLELRRELRKGAPRRTSRKFENALACWSVK